MAVTTAQQREHVIIRNPVSGIVVYDRKVGAPCGWNKLGVWCCLTHQQHFHTDMEKDHAVSDGGEHRLVFLCHDHGPEVP